MSKSRFIKLIDSEKTEWLLFKHPNAFLLLTIIAKRARRISGHIDGLQIGDALIGDHESAGLSRQQYRTALKKLIEFGLVEIIYNGKKFLKREKSTIKVTIKGMLVNLKDSSIYDINSEDDNQQVNQRATNSQPTANHEQERNKKEEECKEIRKKISKERSPLAIALLDEFHKSLLLALPSFNQSKLKKTDAQISAMERLLPVHGEEKVRQVFIYAHTSLFWKAHVHTAVYLEKKFETLMAQIEPQKGNQNANHQPTFKQSSDIKPRGPLRARNVLKAVPGDT